MQISIASDIEAFARPIQLAFGQRPTAEGVESLSKLIDPSRAHVACVDGNVVGAAGAYTHSLATPGGIVSAAGICCVAVLPTHRRRGILSRLLQTQFADIESRAEGVAYLWASEESIYRKFGYGMASQRITLEWESRGAEFRDAPARSGAIRLVEPKNSYEAAGPIYARLWREHPGIFHRTETWWCHKTLSDRTLQCAVLEDHAYTLYRISVDPTLGPFACKLDVIEFLADSFEACQQLWVYLLGIDLVKKISVFSLPIDYPLTLMLKEPRKMNMRVVDGVWLRIVNVERALRSRGFGEGTATIQVLDELIPANAAVWQVSRESVSRSSSEADITIDVSDLGSVYLGAFGFSDLARAGRVKERRPGGIRRADGVFAWDRKPSAFEFF